MHGASAWKGMVFSAIVGLAGDVGRDLVRRASRFHRRPAAYAVRLDSIVDKLRRRASRIYSRSAAPCETLGNAVFWQEMRPKGRIICQMGLVKKPV
ncbi:hypothetical protein C1881_07780 [Slackia isoflavoniconvertens]|uniref:Uncharacterized protein n=1 Tax=Slackia isoflavoniconvertens TaxID=572010 RepID=A0A369LF26_9ACTN|nr:hypothetical protein C1881_07780 [Slackia isoflavoniconvertens]